MVQWRGPSAPTNVAWVRFPRVDAVYRLSLLLVLTPAQRVLLQVLGIFFPTTKTNISKFQFEQAPRELFGVPWVNKLYFHVLYYKLEDEP